MRCVAPAPLTFSYNRARNSSPAIRFARSSHTWRMQSSVCDVGTPTVVAAGREYSEVEIVALLST